MKKRATVFMAGFMAMWSMVWTGCSRKENMEFIHSEPSYSEMEVGDHTIVSIGSLTLMLPEGWQMKMRKQDGMTQYVLADIHSQCESEEVEGHKEGYEHEIVITPYEISQMPEDTLQLTAEMKEFFSVPVLYGAKGSGKTREIRGCWMYGENRDTEEKEYFLFSGNDSAKNFSIESLEKRELFHIRESDISSFQNEVETFWEFLDKGWVYMGDELAIDGNRLSGHSDQAEYYFWFDRQSAPPLFVVMQSASSDQDGLINVYQKGDYETLVASLSAKGLYPDQIEIMDVDQDGDEDFVCRYWLVDTLNSLAFAEEEDFDGYLWDEEHNTFLYTAGDAMLAQYGYVWERKNNPDSQTGAELIPDGLIDCLTEHLSGSREELQEIMSALVSDRELTLEEVLELAGDNIAIRNEILRIASFDEHKGIWLQVDADNDGIEDIYLCEFLGGSLGSVYYYLFAGKADGSYELTDRKEELQMEFGFLQWEGKNYLAKTTWNFTKKIYDGILLECYENGIYQGGVWLAITPKEGSGSREILTSYVKEEAYRSLEEHLWEFAGKYHAEERVGPGTAETKNEEAEYYERSSDLDNDGEAEEYSLSLWQTTNYYTVDCINFEAKEEEINTRVWGMINEEDIKGIPLNLWVDETEYGNIVFILYEEGLYDFHICGWLMSETGEEKLIQVDCMVQTEVTKNILTYSLPMIK